MERKKEREKSKKDEEKKKNEKNNSIISRQESKYSYKSRRIENSKDIKNDTKNNDFKKTENFSSKYEKKNDNFKDKENKNETIEPQIFSIRNKYKMKRLNDLHKI